MKHLAPLLVLFSLVSPLFAHDMDPDNDTWYRSLHQPDAPAVSCCGIADAYWCDDISTKDGKVYCAITDDRDDTMLDNRPHVEVGTKIEIPAQKLKWEQDGQPIGNPTGHSVVFLSVTRQVYCFVQSTGI